MNRLKLGLICISLLMSSAIAAGKPHTWHKITASQGSWEGRLQMINQGGSFVTRSGHEFTNFVIDANHPQEFGFIFDPGDDFDLAYTLTLTEKSARKLMFESKSCVYVITAKGPANPDITPLSYHGAKCEWSIVKGVGEDFNVG